NAGANALHAGIDSRLLLFTLVVTVTTGFMSGLAPACQSGRRSLASSLRQRNGPTSGHVRLRKIIVSTQIALALPVVVAAGLCVRAIDALMTKGPGFETSSLVSFDIDARRDGYSTAEGERMMGRIDEAIHHSPIIQASAIANFPLLTGGSWNDPMTI